MPEILRPRVRNVGADHKNNMKSEAKFFVRVLDGLIKTPGLYLSYIIYPCAMFLVPSHKC